MAVCQPTNDQFSRIERRLINIMSEIENLRSAVDANIQANAQGFEAIGSALQELTTDIQNLPQATDIQAEADRLAANAQTITNAFTDASQQIRDALPTEQAATPAGGGEGGESPAPDGESQV